MRILIAEDDVTTRLMLSGILNELGFAVCEAANGHEAWEHFAGAEAAPLAIIDWVMPGMSGPELCRKVKARARKEPPYIIMLTSKSERQDVVHGLDSGADDFMVKPCDIDELRARIAVGSRIVNLQHELCEANERLEQRVERRTREVEHMLHRMQDLLHHLSHDLKTPLTPLLSMLPILLETEGDSERREMLELALNGARGVHTLVSRVLELCRAEAAAPALSPLGVDLGQLVNAALAQFRAAHSLMDRILCNEVPVGCSVRADPLLVREVLGHLLGNAVQFTAPDGLITIRAAALNGAIRVAVADDGIGLDEHDLAHVFEPFFKSDPSRHDRGAVGLGLAISRTLVERQGGLVGAESAGSQRGATFWFTLPSSNAQ